MAELFIARTTAIHGFEKLVALKRVLPQHASNARLIRMLMHEARLSANLHHPNIAQVYDVGEYAGTYFFTMEYILGKDLRDIVRAAQGRGTWMPLEHAIGIVIGVAAALQYAHTARGPDGQPLGIIHRDVSPSNILVTYDGGVKLVDFGIAIAASLDAETGGQAPAGKIAYMSPEQCRDDVIDARSDIFSLGVVLWELTVRRRLFVSKGNPVALLTKIATESAMPPSSVVEDFPEELERIVLKALALEREDRYASARELQVDLEEFAHQQRLPITSTRLAEYMQALFSAEIGHPPVLQLDGVEEEREVSLSRHEPPALVANRAPAPVFTLPPIAAEAPARRRPGVLAALAVAAGALTVLVWMLARPGAPPREAPALELVSVPVPADSPAPLPVGKAPPVSEPPQPPPTTAATTAKKVDKRGPGKKKQTWDPNSALPPS